MQSPTESALHRMGYTVGEVAKSLGICDKTVYKLIRNGILKPFLRSPILISKSELERITNDHSPTS